MKQMKNKCNRTIMIISLIFIFCGVIMLCGGIYFALSNAKFSKNALTTTGIISNIEIREDHDGDIHHSVYVSYRVDNIDYTDISLGYYTSGMYEGDAITLYYDPSNPTCVKTKAGAMFETMLLFGMGVVFAAIGSIFMIPVIRHKKKKKLIKTGRCIRLPITGIQIDTSTRVNGIEGHFILCDGIDSNTGRRLRYKSDNYYVYLDTMMNVGDIVPIYIDRNNPDNYYVDVENVELQNAGVRGLPEDTFYA